MDYKENFSFTKKERQGILAFFILTVSTILAFNFLPRKSKLPDDFDISQYYLPDDSLTDDTQTKNYEYDNDNDFSYDGPSTSNKPKKTFQQFAFDPNDISKDSLMMLGFSAFGSTSVVNFISKGGKIKDIQKFKTIFGIDTNLVNELESYISYDVAKTAIKEEFKQENKFKKEVQVIEINTADSIQWEQLPGIGAYLTSKILKNRTKIGGFLYLEQLTELSIIQDSVFQKISPYLTVNSTKINKININTADFMTFLAHPYFSKETANAILMYRKQHGDFQDVAHIRRIKYLKEATGVKILPYLDVR